MMVAAALPPQLDGIGDYTTALTAQLISQAQCDITILTGSDFEPAPVEGARIVPTFRYSEPASVAHIREKVIAERPDWLLLQYNPFAYGKWGLNLYLPRVLRDLKKECPGLRLAVMFHEAFVPVISWKFAVMTTWQRLQLWQLGQAADAAFFSIQPWAQRYQSWFPHTPVTHLPVGSNIARVQTGRTEARERLGFTDGDFVVGMFGTAHVSRMLPLIGDTLQALAKAGHKVTLLYIGPNGEAVRAHIGRARLNADGCLPGYEVSRRFAAMDMYLAPFRDGVSTRRTSLMTALQHGIAVVGTWGVWTDDLLLAENGKAFVLCDTRQERAFQEQALRVAGDANLRVHLGRGAAELFAREFTWERIAGRLLDTLTRPGIE